jgi:hypothetical protein
MDIPSRSDAISDSLASGNNCKNIENIDNNNNNSNIKNNINSNSNSNDINISENSSMTVISNSDLNRNMMRNKISILKNLEDNCEEIIHEVDSSNKITNLNIVNTITNIVHSQPVKLEQRDLQTESVINLKNIDQTFQKSQQMGSQDDVKNSKSESSDKN